MPFALLVLCLLIGGLGLLLVLNTASAANELRRHTLATQDVGVAARLQRLANQVAASAAPGNLAVAAAALGMVPADDPAFLVIEPDGSVRVLGRPGPATAAPLAGAKKTAAKTSAAKTSAAGTSAGRTSRGRTSAATTSAGRAAGASSSAPRSPSPSTTSSTPTPTVTLPGGGR